MSILSFIATRQPLPDELRAGLREARGALGDADQLVRVRHGVREKLASGGAVSLAPLSGGALLTRGQWLMLSGAALVAYLGVLGVEGASRLRVPQAAAAPSAPESLATDSLAPSYLVLGRGVAPEPEPEPRAAPGQVTPRPHRERLVAAPAPARLDAQGELALLRVAQAELRNRPVLSLEQVQLHETRYPEGVFAQEREVIRIDALFELRRDEEARQMARRFLDRFAESTHALRMRALLGEL